MLSAQPSRKYHKLFAASLLVLTITAAFYLMISSDSQHLQQLKLEAEEFNLYISSYNKQYSPKEYPSRFKIFRDNLAYIRVFNSMNHPWTLGINELADLTREEFKAFYTGLKSSSQVSIQSDLPLISLPQSVDWTTQGAVTPVKNQGQCGSCWSFSTTGAVEGAWFLSTKNLVSLSEQQLISCSQSYGNNGCNGGLMNNAFEYIIANGITSEANYPYTAKTGTCNKSLASQVVARLTTYNIVMSLSAVALQTAIVQQPVSVAVEADQSVWQLYSGGTVTSNCGTNLDHGVLAVGYNLGTNPPYYKVKNSWGASWGMAGYIQIGINGDGTGVCGIQIEPSFPIV